MKEKILNLLKQEDYKPMTLKELESYFQPENYTEFLKAIVSLEENKEIIRSSKDKYHLPSSLSMFKGKVQMNKKGFAFIMLEDEEEVFVPASKLHGALNNDIVMVRILSENFDSNPDGEVVSIVERGTTKVVGLVAKQGQQLFLKSDDPKFADRIIINVNKTMGAVVGHKVVVEITDYNTPVKGNVVKIIGHKNDPGVDILSVIERYDVDVEFSEEVYREIEKIKDYVSFEELEGRRDFREWQIATIDGDDAKDLDDAISVYKDEKGHYHLGVHIADVSNYVKEGTALDNSAVQRGTSIYLVDRVIPMLPHKLSNGICSLNPNVDRLTVSCLMEIDGHGNVIDHEIVPSVINSKLRMTYNNANKVLNREKFPKEYANFIDFLDTANELAHILRHKRDLEGAIDFDTKEAKVVLNEKGKVKDIVIRERGDAEKLIEEMMLVANETVAQHMRWLELPYIYRIHEKPLVKKLQKLQTTLSPLGYHLKGSLDDIHPKALQDLLNTSKDLPEHSLVSMMVLRSMSKAKYSEECLGHFGLADEYYSHFTSPIRRYPDLLGHRLLHKFLFDQKTDLETVNHYEAKVPQLAKSSSDAELVAVDMERDVEDMKKAEYMLNHIGEEFEGMISSVTRFGFFVELPNTIEGLVHISELKGDYYEYDDFKNRLVGQKTGKVYQLLDSITVRCVRANKTEGNIDFEVVEKKEKKKQRKKVIESENYFEKYYNTNRKRKGKGRRR